MHRSAPVGRGLTGRSLGRSLRANAMRVRRGRRMAGTSLVATPSARVLASLSLHLKNKIFLGKKLGRSALSYTKNYKDGAMPRLLRAVLQNQITGAGVVRARLPHNYACLRQNLVRANFAASKNKNNVSKSGF